MSLTHYKLANRLFWFQVFVTIAFFIPVQIKKLLAEREGVILTPFLLVSIYCVFVLVTAIRSHRAAPSETTKQMIWIWVLGIIAYVSFTTIFVLRTDDIWNPNDTVNAICALIGVGGAIALVKAKRLPVEHPAVPMSIALSFRIVPQLMLALNVIAKRNADGLSWAFIWCFHIALAGRIWLSVLMVRENGADMHRKCILVAESLSWASWCVVTTAWIMY